MGSPYAPGQTILDNCGNYTPIIPDLPPNGAWDNGGPSNGNPQVVTGSFSNPNGNATPPDTTKAALYYQDNATISFWQWSVTNQTWQPIVT